MTESVVRRWGTAGWRSLTVLGALMLALPAPGRADDAATIFQAQCALCHGQTGGGDGPAAAMLKPSPTKFSDADYWTGAKPAALEQVILKGKPGTAMVPFGGTLSEEQVAGLVEYLRTLAR